MKRRAGVFLLFLLFFCVFPIKASALDAAAEEDLKTGITAILPDAAKPYLPSPTDTTIPFLSA